MLAHRNPKFEPPERVVVVGRRGVIGAELCARLENAAIPLLALSSSDIDLLAEDSTDRLAERLAPGDALVMLAALTPDKGRDRATFLRNIAMADTVCAAIERQPVSHVVYMSSDAVYPMGTELLTEESCAAPDDLYGTMHRAREVLFADAVGETPLAVLRCTLVCAASDTHNSYGPNRFRRLAATDGKIKLGGAGEETRDHIAVGNVAETIGLVLGWRSAGVVNLATGRSASFDEVARMVAACYDPPAKIVHTERSGPISHRHFDITALRRAFPDLRMTDLEATIQGVHGNISS